MALAPMANALMLGLLRSLQQFGAGSSGTDHSAATLPLRSEIDAVTRSAKVIRVRLVKEHERVHRAAQRLRGEAEDEGERDDDDDEEGDDGEGEASRRRRRHRLDSPASSTLDGGTQGLSRHDFFLFSSQKAVSNAVMPCFVRATSLLHGSHPPISTTATPIWTSPSSSVRAGSSSQAGEPRPHHHIQGVKPYAAALKSLVLELVKLLTVSILPAPSGSFDEARQWEAADGARSAISMDHHLSLFVQVAAPLVGQRVKSDLSLDDAVLLEVLLTLLANLMKTPSPSMVEHVVGALCRSHCLELLMVCLQQNKAKMDEAIDAFRRHHRIEAADGEHPHTPSGRASTVGHSSATKLKDIVSLDFERLRAQSEERRSSAASTVRGALVTSGELQDDFQHAMDEGVRASLARASSEPRGPDDRTATGRTSERSASPPMRRASSSRARSADPVNTPLASPSATRTSLHRSVTPPPANPPTATIDNHLRVIEEVMAVAAAEEVEKVAFVDATDDNAEEGAMLQPQPTVLQVWETLADAPLDGTQEPPDGMHDVPTRFATSAEPEPAQPASYTDVGDAAAAARGSPTRDTDGHDRFDHRQGVSQDHADEEAAEEEEDDEETSSSDEEGLAVVDDELIQKDEVLAQLVQQKEAADRGEAISRITRWNLVILECTSLIFRVAPAAVIATLGFSTEQLAGPNAPIGIAALAQTATLAEPLVAEVEHLRQQRALARRNFGPAMSTALFVKREVAAPTAGPALPSVAVSGVAPVGWRPFAAVGRASALAAAKTPLDSLIERDNTKRVRFARKALQQHASITSMPLPTQLLLAHQFHMFSDAGFAQLSSMVWPEIHRRILEVCEYLVTGRREARASRGDRALDDEGPLLSALDDVQLGDAFNYIGIIGTLLRFAKTTLRLRLLAAEATQLQATGVSAPTDASNPGFVSLAVIAEVFDVSHFDTFFKLLATTLQVRSAFASFGHDVASLYQCLAEMIRILVFMIDGQVSHHAAVKTAAITIALSITYADAHLKALLAVCAEIALRPRLRDIEAVVCLAHGFVLTIERIAVSGQFAQPKRKAPPRRKKAPKSKVTTVAAADSVKQGDREKHDGPSDVDAATGEHDITEIVASPDHPSEMVVDTGNSVLPDEPAVSDEAGKPDDDEEDDGEEDAPVDDTPAGDKEVSVASVLTMLAKPRTVFFLLHALRLWRLLPDDAIEAVTYFLNAFLRVPECRSILFTLHVLLPVTDILRAISQGQSAHTQRPQHQTLFRACLAVALAFFSVGVSQRGGASVPMSTLELSLRCARSLFLFSSNEVQLLTSMGLPEPAEPSMARPVPVEYPEDEIDVTRPEPSQMSKRKRSRGPKPARSNRRSQVDNEEIEDTQHPEASGDGFATADGSQVPAGAVLMQDPDNGQFYYYYTIDPGTAQEPADEGGHGGSSVIADEAEGGAPDAACPQAASEAQPADLLTDGASETHHVVATDEAAEPRSRRSRPKRQRPDAAASNGPIIPYRDLEEDEVALP